MYHLHIRGEEQITFVTFTSVNDNRAFIIMPLILRLIFLSTVLMIQKLIFNAAFYLFHFILSQKETSYGVSSLRTGTFFVYSRHYLLSVLFIKSIFYPKVGFSVYMQIFTVWENKTLTDNHFSLC